MDNFQWTNPWLIACIAGIIGFLLGMGALMLTQRQKSGGKTVDQLREEMEEYRAEVSKHFATTSELFRDMTEKYRDVYNHLASGSQTLCEDPMEHGRLEFTDAKPVAHEADAIVKERAAPSAAASHRQSK